MTEVVINYWAVLVCAVSAMAIGALWYSPLLFAKPWVQLVGKSLEDLKKSGGKPTPYVVTFLLDLLMAYILAHFVGYVGATNAAMGVQAGLWLWLGFVITTMMINGVFTNKPWKLYAIDGGFHLVNLMIMGAILASWH